MRDRLILHAVSEAYRNIMPPTSFPVILMFLEMPPEEVDVNVHPAKTEVRFRQSSFIHDFVRDSLRNALIQARPAAGFLQALTASPNAASAISSALLQDVSPLPGEPVSATAEALASEAAPFQLSPPEPTPITAKLPFSAAGLEVIASTMPQAAHECDSQTPVDEDQLPPANLNALASLKPLGQMRESFILAINDEGLWIIDQHVAHERVLFEKILRERQVERVQRQRLLMPMLVDLLPQQMVVFAAIARELEHNGFDAEPFGPRTIAIKAAPIGLEGNQLERMLIEVLEQSERESQRENLETMRTRIAASIACHAAIKVNTPLDPTRMEWLLAELAKTEHPTSCPHGRPIALRYAWKDIQRAFQRI